MLGLRMILPASLLGLLSWSEFSGLGVQITGKKKEKRREFLMGQSRTKIRVSRIDYY